MWQSKEKEKERRREEMGGLGLGLGLGVRDKIINKVFGLWLLIHVLFAQPCPKDATTLDTNIDIHLHGTWVHWAHIYVLFIHVYPARGIQCPCNNVISTHEPWTCRYRPPSWMI